MFDICLQFFDNRVKFTLALLLLKPLLKINQSKDILIINKLKGASYLGSSFFSAFSCLCFQNVFKNMN